MKAPGRESSRHRLILISVSAGCEDGLPERNEQVLLGLEREQQQVDHPKRPGVGPSVGCHACRSCALPVWRWSVDAPGMLGNPAEGATTRRVSTAPISFPQVVPLKLVQGLDRSEHGESAYAFGEGARASRTLPFDPDAAWLREQLVVETTRRTVQALTEPDPLD